RIARVDIRRDTAPVVPTSRCLSVDLAGVAVVNAVSTTPLVNCEYCDPLPRNKLPNMLSVPMSATRRTSESSVAPDGQRAGVDLLSTVAIHVGRHGGMVTLASCRSVAGIVAVKDPVLRQLPIPPVKGRHREACVVASLLDDTRTSVVGSAIAHHRNAPVEAIHAVAVVVSPRI